MSKVSEYIEILVKQATDLIDLTVDVGGGLFETRKITVQNYLKPRSFVKTYAGAISFDLAYYTAQEVPITGDATVSVTGGAAGGEYLLYLKADATPRTITLDASFGTLLDGFNPIIETEANTTYLVLVMVDPSGTYTHTINKY